MLRSTFILFLFPIFSLPAANLHASAAQTRPKSCEVKTDTIEKLMVIDGNSTIDLDLNRLNDITAPAEKTEKVSLRFAIAPESFFTVVVTSGVLRGPSPGSISFVSQNGASLPGTLEGSVKRLVLEKMPSDSAYDLILRDSTTGFVFFNLVGHQYDYDPETHSLNINDATLLVSEQFARQLGRPWQAQVATGKMSLRATLSPIEVRTIVNGELQGAIMPPLTNRAVNKDGVITAVPGPDIIVGDLLSVEQPSSGINGSFVGLGVGTTSCNNGDQELNWFSLNNNDHPVIPQNLYRMSGGDTNKERFEQIGQSWLKHAFFAEQENACGFGCVSHPTPTPSGDPTHLGVGCSDPYSANLNYNQSGLGARAWVNPFTGFFPRGDSATPPSNHAGHVHTGTSHRVLVPMSDLNTTLNPNATYYAEAQYITPHEYAWCQAHPGQCNMFNNVSYRRFSVSSTNQTNFTFASVGSTVRMQPAIMAWGTAGATINQIEPAPGNDGIGFVGYKVSNPSAGVWHYEYAVYNENLDRAIQSFSVPLTDGTIVSNIGFHAPAQEPGCANDGTVGNTGFSSFPWAITQTSNSITWTSETFAQNQNANAIRWGTLYNFRFDANAPPQNADATVGFFKTGSPIAVAIGAPSAPATPTATPTATATASPTPSTPTPTPTPTPINISGNIDYCSNPALAAVPGVTLTLTGDASTSAVSDASGNYVLSAPRGGNYTVTPTKAALGPGASAINTIDVVAVQRHFLIIGTPLAGCQLSAADVNGSNGVDTIDVVAIQRFFLSNSTGIANVGKYQFLPTNRIYSGPVTDQTGQNYNALVFGDVAGVFVH